MPQNFDGLEFIIGDRKILLGMKRLPAWVPFSDEVLDFLNALSKTLMKSSTMYPDVATFAFWCRRASVLRMKSAYPALDDRMGRGTVFHSTPSNVPVNFAFSFAAGLLDQRFSYMARYICFVKYQSARVLHDYFSASCDTRIIWGGDETINGLRQSPLHPRANEVTFADRFSLAVIDAEAYLRIDDKERVASDFYNDTYYSDQNACTAPRIIVWTGSEETIATAKENFWELVGRIVDAKYAYLPVQAIGKLSALYSLTAAKKGARAHIVNNALFRITLPSIDEDRPQYAYHSGFFMEYDAKDLSEILPLLSGSTQTIAYLGNGDALMAFLMDQRPAGVDRIVPFGRTMDFSLVWDGVDLIYTLSRVLALV